MDLNQQVSGVLVEPRYLASIPQLIQNFKKVLPNCKLYFFCGKSSFPIFFNLYGHDSLVHLIPLETDNLTPNSHNDFLKTSEFWNHFDTDYILTIQTDGCLCENSPYKISDFLHYDYIGGYTPFKWWWKETNGLHSFDDFQSFNGGFSLRKVQAMKEVICAFPPTSTQPFSQNLPFTSYGEDLYFVVGMLKLNKQSTEKRKYNVALDEFSVNFCTHTHFIKPTFCVHKLDAYHNVDSHVIQNFLKYCPTFAAFFGKLH